MVNYLTKGKLSFSFLHYATDHTLISKKKKTQDYAMTFVRQRTVYKFKPLEKLKLEHETGLK